MPAIAESVRVLNGYRKPKGEQGSDDSYEVEVAGLRWARLRPRLICKTFSGPVSGLKQHHTSSAPTCIFSQGTITNSLGACPLISIYLSIRALYLTLCPSAIECLVPEALNRLFLALFLPQPK